MTPIKSAALALATTLLAQLPAATAQQTSVIVPAGTLVPLNLTTAIKHKSTKPGDTVRATVSFPITVGDQIAIPAGTIVEGSIAPPTKGKKPANAPPVAIHFTRLVYANGYTISLDAINSAALTLPALPTLPPATDVAQLDMPRTHGPSPSADPDPAPDPQYPTTPTATNPYAHDGPTTKEVVALTVGPVALVGAILTFALLHRAHGDYLIEAAGWQFQMILQNPVAVDAARVDAAASTATP